MNSDCLFCKIAARTIPAEMIYEDDDLFAIRDIHPKAPIHLLVIPKKHIQTIDDVEEGDKALVGQLIYQAKLIAREQGLAEQGYRLVFNVRHHAGQTVDHIHLHILGGKPLGPMITA